MNFAKQCVLIVCPGYIAPGNALRHEKRKWDSQPKVALSQLSNRTSLVKPLSCSLSCSTSSPSLLPSPKALGLLAPRGYATGVPLFLRHEKRTPFVRGFSPLEFCKSMCANRLSGIHCPWQCAALSLTLASRRRLSACVRTPFALLRNTKVGENPLVPVPKRKKPKTNTLFEFRFFCFYWGLLFCV